MATTTFSGPIKAGTIKSTTGTTLGSNISNVGQVVMAQTFSVDLSGGAVAAQVTDVVIPANSQIIDCVIDVITAANTSTNLSVGDTVGGAATILNTFASGSDAGFQNSVETRNKKANEKNLGTSDYQGDVDGKRSKVKVEIDDRDGGQSYVKVTRSA